MTLTNGMPFLNFAAMKRKVLLFSIFYAGIMFNAFSQSSQFKGGYGHFMIGPGWFTPDEYVDYLRQPQVMGTSLDWRSMGIHVGGEGFAEIRGLLLGGGGYGLMLPSMRADSATAWVFSGGGYFKTGYVPYQTGRQFLAITAAFGAGGIGTNIKNNSKGRPLHFDPEDPVDPGKERSYGIAFALFDVGLSYKVVSSGEGDEMRGRYSGFMFGIDAGASIGLRMDEWRDKHGAIGRIDTPDDYVSPYIRITIGGGGFRRPVVE
jgi:hypothetical protein